MSERPKNIQLLRRTRIRLAAAIGCDERTIINVIAGKPTRTPLLGEAIRKAIQKMIDRGEIPPAGDAAPVAEDAAPTEEQASEQKAGA